MQFLDSINTIKIFDFSNTLWYLRSRARNGIIQVSHERKVGLTMPLISVNAVGTLTAQQKDAIKAGLGHAITLIPGKKEKALMVDISDGHALYLGGNPLENGAFVDVRIFKDAEFDDKKAMTEAIFALLEKECGIPANQIYLTFTAHAEWGLRGTLY